MEQHKLLIMKKITTFILLLGLIVSQAVMAIPAKPVSKTFVQPDGSRLTIVLQGDEHFSYYSTTDQIMLAKDKDGYMRYAVPANNNGFVPGKYIASNPGERNAEVKSYLKEIDVKIENALAKQRDNRGMSKMPGPIGSSQFPNKGEVRGLVIMAEFTDRKFSEIGTNEEFTKMMNEEGYSNYRATGSARDYFVAQSRETFFPTFDVVGPVSLPQNMEFYGKHVGNTVDQNPAQMIVDACNAAKKEYNTDFSQYDLDNDGKVDLVYVIYAGYAEAQGAPDYTVWPHAWDISYGGLSLTLDGKSIRNYACSSELRDFEGMETDGIGSFCHEFSHCLGIPDFYDAQGTGGYGLGYWSIMDRGCYNNDSRTPPYYSAFERYNVSWLEPVYLEEPQDNITMEAYGSSGKAYFIKSDQNKNEYYTLENRQQEGWDRYLPGHGLMITHINYDPSAWTSNTVNRKGRERVQIVPADNTLSLNSNEGDVFPGPNGNDSFTDVSLPESVLATGDYLSKPITRITEKDGVISFDFKDYTSLRPVLKNATAISDNGFMARWTTIGGVSSYTLEIAPETTGQPLLEKYVPSGTTGEADGVFSPLVDLMNNETFTACIELEEAYAAGSALKLAWYERADDENRFLETNINTDGQSEKLYWVFNTDMARGYLKITAGGDLKVKNLSIYTGNVKEKLLNNSLPVFEAKEQKQVITDIQSSMRKVTGLLGGNTYYYSLSTVVDGVASIPSVKKSVETTSASGIQANETTQQVYVSGNRIYFSAGEGETVRLYTVDGLLKESLKAVDGENSVQVENGIYILRTDSASVKVTVMQ